jgi:hypothetical protein
MVRLGGEVLNVVIVACRREYGWVLALSTGPGKLDSFAMTAVILGNDPKACDGIYPRTSDGRCQGCGIVGEHPRLALDPRRYVMKGNGK